MEDREFTLEQQHLTETWQKLNAIRDELETRLGSLAEKVPEEKQQIRESLTLNYDTGDDIMETYIEFEVMNHVIDHYNIESDAAHEKLVRVKKLLEAPYFARVRLQFDPDEEPEDYYIGVSELSENGYDPIVIDWRSPIAETYYSQENGKTSYEVDGHRIETDLLLRRQFALERDRLKAYFDTQIAIEDPLLLQSLAAGRSDQLKAITATIQKEQNEIIRCPDVPTLLVSGIAGSGKTSVLLQRIAYLFYKKRESLRPDDVYLITLNPVFRRYIDNVLPDMGERNPNALTWTDFLSMVGVPRHSGEADEKDLQVIDTELASLQLEEDDVREISQGSLRVLTKKQIVQALRAYPHIPTGVRLLQIVQDDLLERAKASIRRKEAEEKEEGNQGSTETKEDNRINSQYGGAFQAIRRFQWLDIDRIGKRLLGKKSLSDAAWYYLKMSLTGECDRNAKYCLIDEVQDYSLPQLAVLRKYFINAKFMLLGDEFQAIRKGTATFADLRTLFGTEKNPVTELSLMTSYRSSPEITALFTALLPPEKARLTTSVRREGTKPVLKSFETPEALREALAACIREGETRTGLTAIICGSRKSLEKTRILLGEDAPEVLEKDSVLPPKGVVLLELALAKGLEFDACILPDADERMYPDEPLARHRLYTALSRATAELSVFNTGRRSPLLPQDESSGA